MRVTKFPKQISRKYLRLASVYRRFAERSAHYDFSLEALSECHRHESVGSRVSKMNGYAHGKRQKDISVVMWVEDIRSGQACKAEFMGGTMRGGRLKRYSMSLCAPRSFPLRVRCDVLGN